jgi:tetratricopeptide (TPR) repeat protein
LKAATDLINLDTPDSNDTYIFVNLGTALGEIGQAALSAAQYRKAIDVDGENVDAHYFLGLTLQDMGRNREAADTYAVAASLDRMHWESMSNLGAVLLDLTDYSGSVAAFSEAIGTLEQREVEPTNAPYDPFPILSQLYYRRGMALSGGSSGGNRGGVCVVQAQSDDPGGKDVDCGEMAKFSFSKAVSYDEGNEAAKHMLAALTADATMKRASNSYVKGLFDEYAGNFEHSLVVDLGYKGFQLLRNFVGEVLGEENLKFGLVVDAGCGTGLIGNEFRGVSRTLVGMDLSKKIIDEAKIKRPGLYDRTYVGDIVEGIRAEGGEYSGSGEREERRNWWSEAITQTLRP